jgi:hypothetical protein
MTVIYPSKQPKYLKIYHNSVFFVKCNILIFMGRNKKYITNEQKRLVKQRDNQLYYMRNKEHLKRTRMENYRRSKEMDTKLSQM